MHAFMHATRAGCCVCFVCREWRDFLLRKQPTGASLSCVFGRGMLRSLLLCCCSSLLRDIMGGPLGFCCAAIYHRLCDEASLSLPARQAALHSLSTQDPTLEVYYHLLSLLLALGCYWGVSLFVLFLGLLLLFLVLVSLLLLYCCCCLCCCSSSNGV